MTSGGPAGFNLPSLRLARGSRGEYGQKRCIASTPTAAHGEPPLPHPAAHPRSRRHLPVRAVPAAGSRRPAATLYDGWGSRTATRRTSPGKPVPRLDGRAAPSGAARRTRSTPAAARDREDGRPAMRTASSRRGVPPRGSSQARCYFLAWLALIAASMLLYFAAMMMTCGVTRAAAYANGLAFVAAYNNSVSEFHVSILRLAWRSAPTAPTYMWPPATPAPIRSSLSSATPHLGD